MALFKMRKTAAHTHRKRNARRFFSGLDLNKTFGDRGYTLCAGKNTRREGMMGSHRSFERQQEKKSLLDIQRKRNTDTDFVHAVRSGPLLSTPDYLRGRRKHSSHCISGYRGL
ncbi:hypothetical protein F2P81_016645 [Scophthalmus maximus]|uniref:Uncharacterized protein n=1 Tax=Scophthalmus maximus TaxID=52904 RepID=A0A6A4SJQ2_SCOMX|nr:hypothetical protein F2P81_016645 [Scophthalmus maximus]